MNFPAVMESKAAMSTTSGQFEIRSSTSKTEVAGAQVAQCKLKRTTYRPAQSNRAREAYEAWSSAPPATAAKGWLVAPSIGESSLNEALVSFVGVPRRDSEALPERCSTGRQFIPSRRLARFLVQSRLQRPGGATSDGRITGRSPLQQCRDDITIAVDQLLGTLGAAAIDSGKSEFDLCDKRGLLLPAVARGIAARLGIDYYAESTFATYLRDELVVAVDNHYLENTEGFVLGKDRWGHLRLKPRTIEIPESIMRRGLKPLAEKGRVVKPVDVN